MAIQTLCIIPIGGPVTTIGEAEAFIAQARAFGADSDTPLLDGGYMSIEFVGTPTPTIDAEGVVTVAADVTVYTGE